MHSKDCCDLCNGCGLSRNTEGVMQECLCVLKQKALNYLTEVYQRATWRKELKGNLLEGINVVIHELSPDEFKSIFKSFLLNTGMTYTHFTISGYDVMQRFLRNVQDGGFDYLSKPDVLVLYLVSDYQMKGYGGKFETLIQKRMLYNKSTWIYTPHSINSIEFKSKYGDTYATESFTQFLTANFSILKGGGA